MLPGSTPRTAAAVGCCERTGKDPLAAAVAPRCRELCCWDYTAQRASLKAALPPLAVLPGLPLWGGNFNLAEDVRLDRCTTRDSDAAEITMAAAWSTCLAGLALPLVDAFRQMHPATTAFTHFYHAGAARFDRFYTAPRLTPSVALTSVGMRKPHLRPPPYHPPPAPRCSPAPAGPPASRPLPRIRPSFSSNPAAAAAAPSVLCGCWHLARSLGPGVKSRVAALYERPSPNSPPAYAAPSPSTASPPCERPTEATTPPPWPAPPSWPNTGLASRPSRLCAPRRRPRSWWPWKARPAWTAARRT